MTKDLTYELIINPNSGKNQKEDILGAVKKKFSNKKIKLIVSLTKKEGHAITLAKKSTANIIIAAGGDGTVNEVINGLIQNKAKKKKKLGIIPMGTANMFARYFNIPKKLNDTLDLIINGESKKIDLGKINNRIFVLAAGIGIDAHLFNNVKPIFKKAFGDIAYPISAITSIFDYEPKLIKVKTNDVELLGYYVIICNVGRYGNALHVAPQAKIDDGLLDVIVFEKKETPDFIKYAFGIMTKQHNLFTDVKKIQTKKLTITSESPVLIHADSELIGKTPANVEIIEDSLEIICKEDNKLINKRVNEIRTNVGNFVKDKIEKTNIDKNNKIFKGINKTRKRIKKEVDKATNTIKSKFRGEPKMEKVQLSGFNNIEPELLKKVKEIAEKQAEKISSFHEDFTVALHLKEFLKTSGKVKYNVDAHLKVPSKNYSSGVTEWDLIKSIRSAFDNVNKSFMTDVEKEQSKKRVK